MEACAKIKYDKQGHEIVYLAAVDCDKVCETCGWNPAEQNRRLTAGEMRETGDVITKLGKLIEIRKLVFPKKEVTDNGK